MWRATLVVSGISGLLSLLYLRESLNYSLGTVDRPGPGGYAILVAVVLLIGSLWTALEAWIQRPAGTVEWPRGTGGRRVLAILAATASYVVLLPYLGYLACSILLTLSVVQVMGLPRWPAKIAVALSMGVGTYYLFAVALGVPLPTGALFG